jgi:hypothetical protein
MNQQALEDICVAAQMRAAHPTTVIEMREGAFDPLAPLTHQAPAARSTNPAPISIYRGLGRGRLRPIAATAVWLRHVRPEPYGRRLEAINFPADAALYSIETPLVSEISQAQITWEEQFKLWIVWVFQHFAIRLELSRNLMAVSARVRGIGDRDWAERGREAGALPTRHHSNQIAWRASDSLAVRASGRVRSLAEVARREGITGRYVERLARLAFVAPEIVEAIGRGQQPAELSAEILLNRVNLPLAWSEQRNVLGIK